MENLEGFCAACKTDVELVYQGKQELTKGLQEKYMADHADVYTCGRCGTTRLYVQNEQGGISYDRA